MFDDACRAEMTRLNFNNIWHAPWKQTTQEHISPGDNDYIRNVNLYLANCSHNKHGDVIGSMKIGVHVQRFI